MKNIVFTFIQPNTRGIEFGYSDGLAVDGHSHIMGVPDWSLHLGFREIVVSGVD